MPRFVIYNFSGYPGDLYQLIPHRYLAGFLSSLNEAFPHSTQLWDRTNLQVARDLSPRGMSKKLLIKLGRTIFQKLKNSEPVSHLLLVPFKLLIDRADGYYKAASERIIKADAEKILKQGVEIVFLNFFQGPGLEQTLLLADILKRKRSAIKIIGVGHRASWLREYIVPLSKNIDAYVMGTHSNRALVRLAQGLPFDKIPNLIFTDLMKKGAPIYTGLEIEQDLDLLPIPEYDETTCPGIKHKISLYEISLTNEACPYRCNFCVRPVNYGTKFVQKSIKNIVDEIEHLLKNFNARYFRISDSTPPAGMLTELAKEIIRRGFNDQIAYSSFSRCYAHPVEDFAIVKKSGCQAVFLGVESGSQKVLTEILNKKATIAGIEMTVKAVKEAGIFVVMSMIMPAPGETKETQTETFDLLKRLKPWIGSVLLQPAGVYPHTEWFNHPEKYGIVIPPDYLQRAAFYPIEPLKPLRFWPDFPFGYRLMDKPASEVTFADIVNCFNEFESRVRKELAIPNIQDYGYIMALAQNVPAEAFSMSVLESMVTRNSEKLAELLTVKSA